MFSYVNNYFLWLYHRLVGAEVRLMLRLGLHPQEIGSIECVTWCDHQRVAAATSSGALLLW
jgi:hypothetical protein